MKKNLPPYLSVFRVYDLVGPKREKGEILGHLLSQSRNQRAIVNLTSERSFRSWCRNLAVRNDASISTHSSGTPKEIQPGDPLDTKSVLP